MDSSIALPLVITGSCLLGMLFFWYTYRNQVEPAGGRGSEDAINAIHAAQLRREIYLENQRRVQECGGETKSTGSATKRSEPSDIDDLDP